MTDEIVEFTLMHTTPLDRLVRGKVVLIGDAAHIMLPSSKRVPAKGHPRFPADLSCGWLLSDWACPRNCRALEDSAAFKFLLLI
jgi:hypothetical protein